MSILTKFKQKHLAKDKIRFHKGIDAIEKLIEKTPGAVEGDNPGSITHSFADGCYVREWRGKKGLLTTTKIHKKAHPFFVLEGEVTIATEDGTKRIKAPYYGITPAGTQRLLYVHEDSKWVTVHVTNETDVGLIEKEVIAQNIEECGGVRGDALPKFIKQLGLTGR